MNRKPLLIAVWSTHRRLLISLGSLFGLNLFLVLFLYFGVTPQLSKTEKELMQLQQELRSSDAVTPQQGFEQGSRDYERFRTSLPSLRNFSELIADLYLLAEQCNLGISQINYTQKGLSGSDLLAYTLKFSLTGTYDELKRFIYGLEESKRLVVIEQVTLNSAKGEIDAGLVSLSLSFTTYFGTEGEE